MRSSVVRLAVTAVAALLLLAGCSSERQGAEPVTISGPTMGTSFNIKYFPSGASEPAAAEVQAEVEGLLAKVNDLMSTYKEDSELSRFNRADVNDWFPVSEETAEVVDLALEISRETQGAFDVTVASLVDLWGFGPSYRIDEPPAAEAIAAELERVGFASLQVRHSPPALLKESPLTLDLSAVAKGYAVDLVAEYLSGVGISSYMVEVGGEIRAKGTKPGQQPWRIAIESPTAGQRSVQRIIELGDIAVATSGDYRNYFEQDGKRYSHTIDPVTGYPITHGLASVTLLSETAARADALATALNVMGPERALAFADANGVPALLIVKGADGFVELSSQAFTAWLK